MKTIWERNGYIYVLITGGSRLNRYTINQNEILDNNDGSHRYLRNLRNDRP